MKLVKIKSLSPKHLFRSKKTRSNLDISSSSGSETSSASSSVHKPDSSATAAATPTSILPQLSGEWSDASSDLNSELYKAFKFLDSDNDGVLSKHELEDLLSRLGSGASSRDETELMLRDLGLGECVGIEELVSRVGSVGEPDCGAELRETFEFFDRDGDGRITADELLGVFGGVMGDDRCTLEECRRMIAEVDRNRDGFVCFEDFSRMMELQIGA